MLERLGCGILAFLIGLASLLWGVTTTVQDNEPQVAIATVVPMNAYDIFNPTVSRAEYFQNPSSFSDEYPYYIAWLMFIELNWPALAGQRGVADPNQQFGAPGLTVWETWKGMDEVYLPDGSTPAAWDTPLPPKLLTETQMIDGQTFTSVSSGDDVHYEVRMNEDTFDYIVQRQFYNRDGQIVFFEDTSAAPVNFPTTAFEVKASWIVLGEGDNPNDYHTSPGFILDENGNQQAVTFGLTGLHLTSKETPQWFWATFENINNATATNAAPAYQPIPPEAQIMNEAVHQQFGSSNIWNNYVVRGVQFDFVNSMELLANTQIETYFQQSSSCITCHSLSSVGSASDGRMPFFNVDASGSEGWIGNIADIVFTDAFGDTFTYDASQQGFIDATGDLRFKQLDFLWSMRRAQWQSE